MHVDVCMYIIIAVGQCTTNGCYRVWVLFVEEQCAGAQCMAFPELDLEVYTN